MRVFVSGLGPPNPATAAYRDLFLSLAAGNRGGHVLADRPEDAEILLFLWGADTTAGWSPAERALLRDRAEDCFTFNPSDSPGLFLAGVYANLSAPTADPFRHRSYCFPFINEFADGVYQRRLAPDLFFSFAGGSTSDLRKKLFRFDFRRDDALVRDTSYHQEWNPHQPEWRQNKVSFLETLARSQFALCPRGASESAGRFFEAMQVGRPLVILSDGYVLPKGPAWERFSIVVPEKDFPRLPELLEPLRPRAEEMGRIAREEWERWFAPAVWFDRIVENIGDIRRSRVRPERSCQAAWPLLDFRRRARLRLRQAAKGAVLAALQVLRLKPRHLNRR